MGEIVGALFTTHIPRLMILDEERRRRYMGEKMSSFYEAFDRVRREKLARLDFDTFVIIDTHWFTTLEYVINAHERLEGIYTSEEIPWMIHEYEYAYPGDPELAFAIERDARESLSGIRVLASQHRGLPIHYATLNVMHYLNPERDKRVLPISVLQTASVFNDLRFGEHIGSAIRRIDRRVVFVASGGLSHRFHPYDVILDYATVDPAEVFSPTHREWDERIMAWFREGRHADIINCAEEFRRLCTPEGRFAHYLNMAGALGGITWKARGIQYGNYENAIGTGQAMFWFDIESSR